jgi:hypothetical protein
MAPPSIVDGRTGAERPSTSTGRTPGDTIGGGFRRSHATRREQGETEYMCVKDALRLNDHEMGTTRKLLERL